MSPVIINLYFLKTPPSLQIIRYELTDGETLNEPPLLFNSYWKVEESLGQVDLRIDYKLNEGCELRNPLLNVTFTIPVVAGEDNPQQKVAGFQCQPEGAKIEAGKLQWVLTELSKHGEGSGSLKARVRMEKAGDGKVEPANTTVQFQVIVAPLWDVYG